MAKKSNTVPDLTDTELDNALYAGHALHAMLSQVNVDKQLKGLKQEVQTTKSPSKRDTLVKKVKYLAGLGRMDLAPQDAFILHNMPVIPPVSRPAIPMGGNKIQFADADELIRDHMLVNNTFKSIKNQGMIPDNLMVENRTQLYNGAKAVVGLGDAIEGSSRGKNLKGFLKQISGESGPKGGYFHSKILSKKQDFSGRATIYAEPNLGFNEAAIPVDMLWSMYEFHIIRDLVKSGYDLASAKKAVADRGPAAQNSFNRLIKQIPIILNRAPTLMQSNITAHYPVPIAGKTIGINPLHLPLYAGDYDGDALSCFVPMTPEAVEEAKKKLLPEHHMYDFREGLGASLVAPGHEAIIGSTYITEPDKTQETVKFKTEQEAINALKAGKIKENTPVEITG